MFHGRKTTFYEALRSFVFDLGSLLTIQPFLFVSYELLIIFFLHIWISDFRLSDHENISQQEEFNGNGKYNL